MLICTSFQEKRHVTTEGHNGNTTLTLYDQQYTSVRHSSPPVHSRMPPDGHEFPSTFSEDNRNHKTKVSRWRRQDERSEKSVKDKIAMFSTEGRGRKIERSDSMNSEKSEAKKIAVEENIHEVLNKKNSLPEKKTSSPVAKPIASSMINVSTPDSKENVQPVEDKKLTPAQRQAEVSNKLSGLNNRSQSLIDIGKARNKRHSVCAYERTLAYKYGIEKPDEKERRASVSSMIEQRRKGKIRGLIIPENKNREEIKRVPVDLPKISSHKTPLKTIVPKEELRHTKLHKTDSISSVDSNSSMSSRHSQQNRKSPPSSLRRTSIGSNKSLSSNHGYRAQSPCEIRDYTSSPRIVSPQRSFDKESTPSHDSGYEIGSKRGFTSVHHYKLETKKAEDSDNDSAVSSTQSSFSQSLSPRASPMLDQSDADDSHSPTRFSRPSHSSQSSFEEIDPKRVLKNGTIEAENRRNILKSAKCSSGKSSDDQSTPEIPRKYSSESRSSYKRSSESREMSKSNFSRDLTNMLSREGSHTLPRESSSKDASSRDSSQLSNGTSTLPRDAQYSAFQPTFRESRSDTFSFSKTSESLCLPEDFSESNIKIAYVNEIVDSSEQVDSKNVITEIIPLPKVKLDQVSDEKWSTLEHKYSTAEKYDSKISRFEPSSISSVRNRSGVTVPKTDFKAVASKWKQMEEVESISQNPKTRKDSISYVKEEKKGEISESKGLRPKNLEIPKADIPDRKYSAPEYGLNREKENPPSRPSSLIDCSESLSLDRHYLQAPLSPSSVSTDSRDEFVDSSESSLSRADSKEILEYLKPQLNNNVTDLRRRFEHNDKKGLMLSGSHPRMSSLDSTTSDDGSHSVHGSLSSLASNPFGSITSLASSASLISPQELAQLIEEANHSLDESGTPSHEIVVVVLHRELVGYGSIGITLAGGADYDTKEITVLKVIPGSLADRDGRIQKGDRILSINGRTLRGVGHREALNILKSPRPEVVLVLSRSRSVTPQESTVTQSNGETDHNFCHRPVFINHANQSRPPKILESPMDSKSLVSDVPIETTPRGPPTTIHLIKDGAGLGFSLEGGKDSPLGDRPLTVKKVFSGGAADKAGVLVVGDQLMSVNSVDLTSMARIEAWNFLKKLPDGKVTLVIRKKLKEDTAETEISEPLENEK